MSKTARKRIPDPFGPGALTVSDGQRTAGYVARQGDEWFSFDKDGRPIGSFDSAIEAARSISKVRP